MLVWYLAFPHNRISKYFPPFHFTNNCINRCNNDSHCFNEIGNEGKN